MPHQKFCWAIIWQHYQLWRDTLVSLGKPSGLIPVMGNSTYYVSGSSHALIYSYNAAAGKAEWELVQTECDVYGWWPNDQVWCCFFAALCPVYTRRVVEFGLVHLLSPAPVLSPSLKAQAGYYLYFLFSFWSNGASKIRVHLMFFILSKFSHKSLSPFVKRSLVGLECCKALLSPSALQPRCSSLPPLSSPPAPPDGGTPLSLKATGKIVDSWAVKFCDSLGLKLILSRV